MRFGLRCWVLRVTLPRVLATTLFVATAASNLYAGVNRWTTHGPEGGGVKIVKADPHNPTILYAGTERSGVFKSIDAGANWTAASQGLANSRITALELDPKTPTTLYAGSENGLFKSIDGGQLWQPLHYTPSEVTPIHTIAIDPQTPTTLYVGTQRGAFKSRDGGASWTALNTLTAIVLTIAIDPQNPVILYATHSILISRTFYDAALFKSTDGGVSWNKLSPPFFPTIIVIDPQTSTTLYGTIGTSIIKSTDGGVSWSTADSGLPRYNISALVIDPQVSTTLYAAGGLVYRSTNGGTSWTVVNERLGNGLIGPAPIEVNALAATATTPTILYAGISSINSAPSAILKSVDGGVTWSDSGRGIGNTFVSALALDPIAPANVFELDSGGHRVTKTSDGGMRWQPLNTTVAEIPTPFTMLALAPTSPVTLYLGPVQYPSSTPGPQVFGLLKSSDQGTHWTPLLPNTHVTSLAINPTQPTQIYAGVIPSTNPQPPISRDGRLIKSADGGMSWTELNLSISGQTIDALILTPTIPPVIYAVAGENLVRSDDDRKSWTLLDLRSPADTNHIRTIVFAIDPQTPTTIYVGISISTRIPSRFIFESARLFKSTNRGAVWEQIGSGLPQSPLSAIVIDPTTPATLYVGTQSGVLKSTDGGVSWSPMNEGLTNLSVSGLVIDASGKTLYAGISGGWVFDFQIGTESADLSITQSDSPDPVSAGTNLTYSFTITNNGSSTATGVQVVDTIPNNVTLVSAIASQGQCAGQPTVVCQLGTLANGKTATVTLVVRLPLSASVGGISNTATVSGIEADPHTTNNTTAGVTAVVTSSGPDLTGFWGSLQKKCKGLTDHRKCTVKGSFMVQNVGAHNAAPSVLSIQAVGSVTFEIARITVPAVKAGKKKKLKVKFVIGSIFPTTFAANVDVEGSVEETNEENNSIVSPPLQ